MSYIVITIKRHGVGKRIVAESTIRFHRSLYADSRRRHRENEASGQGHGQCSSGSMGGSRGGSTPSPPREPPSKKKSAFPGKCTLCCTQKVLQKAPECRNTNVDFKIFRGSIPPNLPSVVPAVRVTSVKTTTKAVYTH